MEEDRTAGLCGGKRTLGLAGDETVIMKNEGEITYGRCYVSF